MELKSHLREIDLIVGRNMRSIRKSRGFTQKQVAELIGVTMQQFQKYETAANRISVSRMLLVAEVLDTQPADLISGAFRASANMHYEIQVQKIIDSIKADPDLTVRALAECFHGISEKRGS